MAVFRTPADTVQIEYEIKKSRFIARAGLASTREEAMALLEEMRVAFPDARHHCWAYLLGNPSTATSAAMSDDGEPTGTAGKPILNVLQHKDIGDVMVVVARYFGGIKLGAGGLVRAYSTAAQQAMEELPVQEHRAMLAGTLHCDFSIEQAVRHWLGVNEGSVEDVVYSNRVTIRLQVLEESKNELEKFALANGCELEFED
ncbi:YigZ family protein [Porticoccaceae bacterium LTM1]|nr:YigZ family protein [Porticoccaceae bacterium LTM1]